MRSNRIRITKKQNMIFKIDLIDNPDYKNYDGEGYLEITDSVIKYDIFCHADCLDYIHKEKTGLIEYYNRKILLNQTYLIKHISGVELYTSEYTKDVSEHGVKKDIFLELKVSISGSSSDIIIRFDVEKLKEAQNIKAVIEDIIQQKR